MFSAPPLLLLSEELPPPALVTAHVLHAPGLISRSMAVMILPLRGCWLAKLFSRWILPVSQAWDVALSSALGVCSRCRRSVQSLMKSLLSISRTAARRKRSNPSSRLVLTVENNHNLTSGGEQYKIFRTPDLYPSADT